VGLAFGVGVPPATAAGDGVLSVTITPVDYATGDPQATAGSGQHGDRVGYRVTYSCNAAVCEDATVQLAPPQPDPYGLAAQNPYADARETLLRYETWTPPASGGEIGGDDTTGKIVSLGDIAPGTGGSFLVVYNWTITGTANVIWAPQFYPGGFQIENSATISSPTATEDRTVQAAPVTWENTVPSPSIAHSFSNGTSVSPGTDVTYKVGMGSGSLIGAGSGRIAGFDRLQAAGGWYVIEQLPTEAEYVSSSDGGVYDPGRHAVIWTRGYDQAGEFTGPVADAGGGWGRDWFSGWAQSRGYQNREVTVRFPAENFPAADENGCNFEQTVDFSIATDVTYLDADLTEKSATDDRSMVVACWDPFGRGALSKDASSDAGNASNRIVDVPPEVAGMVCPESGRDDWARPCTPGEALVPFDATTEYWQVNAYNRGNVPGVVTVVDDDLDHAGMPVYRILTETAATIEYDVRCGSGAPETRTASGRDVQLSAAEIADGCRIVSATVTSGELAAGNVRPTDTGNGTRFYVTFYYHLEPGTEVTGTPVTNTATGTLTYPGHDELDDVDLGPASRNVTLRELPTRAVTPEITAEFPIAPVVSGGGLAVPGSEVTFTVGGTTAGIPLTSDFVPQYVFLAPVGWEIADGSTTFAEGSVPDGVEFAYRTVTVGGDERQAVVASWPEGTVFGRNGALPPMTVVAQPTYAVSAGTQSAYDAWIGDSAHSWDSSQASFAGAVQDTPDVDADDETSEWFSRAGGQLLVSSADAMGITKEICRPDEETEDGCAWISDTSAPVPVSTVATDIRYRVTIQNTGNTQLGSVVGYDVLPHVGDTGTSDGTAGTPRGSQFDELLTGVENVTGDLTLSYSGSTQPYRPEVYTGTGTTDDWGTAPSDARAIRIAVDGSLAPGETVSFEYTASVGEGAEADAVACNSVAVASDKLGVLEPRAVCASTAEADLELTVPDRLPLQEGRPGVVPFTVTNHGGSAEAPATVTAAVPQELTVSSLSPEGWSCVVLGDEDAEAPVAGGATLECTADEPVAASTPVSLELPVVPVDALSSLCVDGVVSGVMYDPDEDNNDASSCLTVASGEELLTVSKDDGVDGARIGDELTYTIDVANLLVGETLDAVTVTDELPSYLAFVSASAGGTVSDQGEADGDGNRPGGVVTWTLEDLGAAGSVGGDGDDVAGGEDASRTVTVTVRVLQSAESGDEVSNTATATATDPADPDAELTDEDTDTDDLVREPAIELTKTADPATVTAAGQTVTYTFTVTNAGDVTLTDWLIDETDFTGTGDPLMIDCGEAPEALAPGDEVKCEARYGVTQADIDAGGISNTAVARATPPAELPQTSSDPSTAVVGTDATASLGLVKTVTPEAASEAGDEVTYTFEVTNTGTVSVADVRIVEDEFTGDPENLSEIVCDVEGAAAPGDVVTCEATYELTQEDIDAGAVTNTATATADAPGAIPDPESDPDTAVVEIPAVETLSLEKTLAEGTTADEAGDTVTYLFEVTNTGNVTVRDVAIDELAFTGAGDAVTIECEDGALAPGEAMTCVGSYELVQADVDAGTVDNTAVATAVGPWDGEIVSDESSARLTIDPDPGLSLVKSVSPGEVALGDEVTYSFVVTNTGNVTLTQVRIAEDAFTGAGELTPVTCGDAASSLAPGAQAVCEATYTVTQDDVDAGTIENTATATGVTPAGADIESDPGSARLPFEQAPALEVVKTADIDGFAAVGDAITYRFRVTNAGNVTMSAINVVEESFSGTGELSAVDCGEPRSLRPGEYVDCETSYEATQEDVDAGELVNTATATGLPPRATDPTEADPSTVTTPFVGTSALVLEKTGVAVDRDDDGVITAGDGIRWSFVVTNAGAATLKTVAIDDPLAGEVSCEARVLPPGASVTCQAPEYWITEDDAAAGKVVNTALATAVGAAGIAVTSDEATASVDVDPIPGGDLAITGGQLGVGLLVLAGLAIALGAIAVSAGRSRGATRH